MTLKRSRGTVESPHRPKQRTSRRRRDERRPARRAPSEIGRPLKTRPCAANYLRKKGVPGNGIAEPRSLQSTIELKRQRTSTCSRLRNGPFAVGVCTSKVESCGTVQKQIDGPAVVVETPWSAESQRGNAFRVRGNPGRSHLMRTQLHDLQCACTLAPLLQRNFA